MCCKLDFVGDATMHVMAMAALMRCADVDAARDLDRDIAPWPAWHSSAELATGVGATHTPLGALPAA
jgi:hypothetical protein